MIYLIIFAKAVLMYFIAYALIRLNRKGIGEQTTYDYTLLIILGTVAADPLESNGVAQTIAALFGLWTGHQLSVSAAKINKIRCLLHGKPKYLVQAGSFNVKEFYNSRLTVPELYSELRLNGHSLLSEIQWAALEPSSRISFIPKSNQLTPAEIPDPVIVDGITQLTTLKQAGKENNWLSAQLRAQGYHAPAEILIAEIYMGRLYLVPR